MTVKQCDRCKKVVPNGYIVEFSYKEFDGYSEKENLFRNKTLDLCNSCYKKLITFLGVYDEK